MAFDAGDVDALFEEVGLDAAQRGQVLVAGDFAQLAGDSGDGMQVTGAQFTEPG